MSNSLVFWTTPAKRLSSSITAISSFESSRITRTVPSAAAVGISRSKVFSASRLESPVIASSTSRFRSTETLDVEEALKARINGAAGDRNHPSASRVFGDAYLELFFRYFYARSQRVDAAVRVLLMSEFEVELVNAMKSRKSQIGENRFILRFLKSLSPTMNRLIDVRSAPGLCFAIIS